MPCLIEVSLNDCQNSMNSMNHDKSKTRIFTKDVLYLAIDIFPDQVGKRHFLLIYLDGYLFSVAHGNRYLPIGSEETFYHYYWECICQYCPW